MRKMPTQMHRLTETEILQIATEVFGKKPEWINWIAAPKAHRFLTYVESNIKFYGADFCAMKKKYILDVFIHYRASVTDEDRSAERYFEYMVSDMGEFEKEHGYNSSDNLFFTHYLFPIEERMEQYEV